MATKINVVCYNHLKKPNKINGFSFFEKWFDTNLTPMKMNKREMGFGMMDIINGK